MEDASDEPFHRTVSALKEHRVNVMFDRQPLDVTSFPANLQNHIKPESPAPLKMMAARGMVPAPPEFGVRLLYQLSFDSDASVASEAKQALEVMPVNILLMPLQTEQPDSVLDWIAEIRREDEAVIEAIVLNKGVDDKTIAMLAGSVNAKLCDLIAHNQVRILRAPLILEELYKNAHARMSTVDKLLDLAQRNNVKLEGLPGVQQALDSNEDLGLQLDEHADAHADQDFEQLLEQEVHRAEIEEVECAQKEAELEHLTRREREQAQLKEAEDDESKPLFARLQNMSIAKKVRLATVGSREAAMLLVKESNRLVHMAAIQNPRLQYSDVKKLATNKSMPDGVVRYMATNRDWTKHYDVMVSLVNNPKTPLSDTMSFLVRLRTNDLRQVMRNRNVPHQIARQAKILVSKRSG